LILFFQQIEEDNRRALAKIMNEKEKALFEQRAKKDSDQRRRMIAEEAERAKRSEDHKVCEIYYFLRFFLSKEHHPVFAVKRMRTLVG
jgi:hypothetical protein